MSQVQQHRQRVFENGVLVNIVGPKRDEITRECRRLNNEQMYDLLSAPHIIHAIKTRRMRMGMWHGCQTEEVQKGFCWEKPVKIRLYHMENLVVEFSRSGMVSMDCNAVAQN
jgi:hypothetical protein